MLGLPLPPQLRHFLRRLVAFISTVSERVERMATRLRGPIHDSMRARTSGSTGRGVLFWTIHKLTVGWQLGGDRLQIWTKRVFRYTWRRIIAFRQCAFLDVGEVDGPV